MLWFYQHLVSFIHLFFGGSGGGGTFPGGSDHEKSASNAGDLGLIPGSGRSPGGENSNPL